VFKHTRIWFFFLVLIYMTPCCDPVEVDDDDETSAGDDDATGDDDDDTTEPADTCPEGMVLIDGGTFTLGEWDESTLSQFYTHQVVMERDLQVSTFCVAKYPFPNRIGEYWPHDGLSLASIVDFEERVSLYDRRLCTVSELLLASAGPDNWRYPYDAEDHVQGMCEPDDMNMEIRLGTFDTCVSPYGVHDFAVRSSWARMENESIVEDAESGWYEERGPYVPFPGIDYAVWGGTSRGDTFYAPTNFGIHFHGVEAPYLDDGVRVCATPKKEWSAQVESEWVEEIDLFLQTNTFLDWLY